MLHEVDVELRTLSTTGGHKIWDASRRLLQYLAEVGIIASKPGREDRLLELGAGTGFLGLSLAKLFPVHVLITDQKLEAAQALLAANVERNQAIHRGRCTWAALDFFVPSTWSPGPFDLIIGADMVYTEDICIAFVATVAALLHNSSHRMLYAHTFRRFDHRDTLMLQLLAESNVGVIDVATGDTPVAVEQSGQCFEDFDLFPEQEIRILSLQLL